LHKRARFYMCASDAMMEEVSAGLQACGVPAFEIFRERFRSPAPSAPRSGATMALQTADHIWILHCQLMDVKINGVESLTQGRCGAR